MSFQRHCTVRSAQRHVRAAGEGNTSPVLRFDTVYSGELSVSANADGTYCMELPAQVLGEEVPDGAGADSTLIQVVLDECLLGHSGDLLQHTFLSILATDFAVAALCASAEHAAAQAVVGDSGLVKSVLYCQVRDELAATVPARLHQPH